MDGRLWRRVLTATMAAMSAAGASGQDAPGGKVDPQINEQFRKEGNVPRFVRNFESEDREVFSRRDDIVATLGLKPGMAVADVGAGTGLFTRLMAEKVGAGGKVYAVDISKDFLEHIEEESAKRGQSQVRTLLGGPKTTNLPPESVDLVFLSDVYHHFEDHEAMLASIRQALRPGGKLIVIEFDRKEGKSSDFVLKHVRAGREQFVREIEAAGFRIAEGPAPTLKENFFARFRKPGPAASPPK